MAISQAIIFSLLLVSVFSFPTEWELKQFGESVDVFESTADFNTTEEVIADGRVLLKEWMNYTYNEQQQVPGAVIGISIKGKVVWKEGFGYSDLENSVPTSADTPWRLASVSKPLTSALVAHLVERGVLSLDTPIQEYLPREVFPIKSWKGQDVNITLRQLLSHTAGVRVTLETDFDSVYLARNATQTLARFKNEPLLFHPGTSWAYSNFGYQVAGAVIEALLKSNYPKEISQFLSKLDMTSTMADSLVPLVRHRPRYYTREDLVTKEQTDRDYNVGVADELIVSQGWWPSMGLISTADNLMKFGNAMINAYKGHNQDYLSQSMVKELWTSETKNMSGTPYQYGKGWFIHDPRQFYSDYPYNITYYHGGNLYGTTTLLMVFPENDIVAVLFSNLGYTDYMTSLLLNIAGNFKHFI